MRIVTCALATASSAETLFRGTAWIPPGKIAYLLPIPQLKPSALHSEGHGLQHQMTMVSSVLWFTPALYRHRHRRQRHRNHLLLFSMTTTTPRDSRASSWLWWRRLSTCCLTCKYTCVIHLRRNINYKGI